MMRVGRLNIGAYLDTLEKMKGERVRATVDAVTEHFPALHDYSVDPSDRAAFERRVRNLLRPIANDLDEKAVPGESPTRGRCARTCLERLRPTAGIRMQSRRPAGSCSNT